QLPTDPGCIAEAEGKVVKVISRLLLSLPAGHEYGIIFMQRPLTEVLASQDQMLRRRGTYKEGANPAAITTAFEKHVREVDVWLAGNSHVKTIRVPYNEVIAQPSDIGVKLTQFLGIELDVGAMARQIDLSLYRNRVPSASK